ncbi:hypothetical protein [Aureivirga sp. CE67]|uniref:hypothetical protein n=1 Tax=Aureivirga sp. CE67 TaxID=1788983 RepID=UPI0018CA4973|nr:hypothetical protein [Aureivirga sp. CE67]
MNKKIFYLAIVGVIFTSCGEKKDSKKSNENKEVVVEKSVYPNWKNQTLEEIKKNKDWDILKEVKGDLNKDEKEDVVLVLESKDSILEKRYNQDPRKIQGRILAVLLNKDGEQKVVVQNNEFLLRGDEGGMFIGIEPELKIANNNLHVAYEFTRSSIEYEFKHKNEDFEILYFRSSGMSGGEYETTEVDFDNQNIVTKTGEIEEDQIETEKIGFKEKPKKLSDFKVMLDWGISEKVYL